MDILNIIGVLLTATGTIITIVHASKAKSYRDEILEDRKKQIFIEILGLTKRAREECRKITTPVDKPIRGVDQQRVINIIQDCYDKIVEYEHRVKNYKIERSMQSFQRKISLFKNAKDQKDKYTYGDEIYSLLNDVISELTKMLDDRI